ncbi:MAG: hypothetical protein HYX55_06560 [Chloroflexi bacterium]|nr:hypothetical protein [Chloroflexota bacterium]
MSSLIRRLVAAAALMGLALVWPGAVGATVTGGCTGEGHSTSSSANLTTDTEWHLRSSDVAGGSGTASTKMKQANVAAYALGIALPIAGGTSQDGDTAGAVDGLSVSTYAILGKRFVVGGSASGDGAPCSGQIRIILDDVNPLLTVLGGGGILVAIVAILILLALSRGGGGCLPRLVGGVFGALGGCGAALAGEQFGFLDPTSFFGLLIAVAAAIVGFLIPGLFGGGGGSDDATPPASPTPTPAAREAPMTPSDMGSTAADVFNAGDTPASPPSETYPGGGVGGGGPM